MEFIGLQQTSLLDFPDRIATVLFTPGCNLRCPFCHNWRIVLEPKGPFLTENVIFQILESRRKYVDSIVISGGEPTMILNLPEFVMELKKRGFSVKIDTNGFFPQVLNRCLPFVDYVALDVKTSLEKYQLLGAKDVSNYLHTIKMLMQGKTDYEFRTTVVPGYVDEADIINIGRLIKGAKRFAFQQFVAGDTLDEKLNEVEPYSSDTILHFAEIMKNYVKEVLLRI